MSNTANNDLESNVIRGKQKKWMSWLSFFITILAWIYVLVYIIYIAYGMIAKAYSLDIPDFFLYNNATVVKTQGLFFTLFIIFAIEIAFMFVWMKYNYVRFSRLDRRRGAETVSNEELEKYFELEPGTVEMLQDKKIIVLEKNIIKDHIN